jgi:hypothetical protein
MSTGEWKPRRGEASTVIDGHTGGIDQEKNFRKLFQKIRIFYIWYGKPGINLAQIPVSIVYYYILSSYVSPCHIRSLKLFY